MINYKLCKDWVPCVRAQMSSEWRTAAVAVYQSLSGKSLRKRIILIIRTRTRKVKHYYPVLRTFPLQHLKLRLVARPPLRDLARLGAVVAPRAPAASGGPSAFSLRGSPPRRTAPMSGGRCCNAYPRAHRVVEVRRFSKVTAGLLGERTRGIFFL